MMRHAAALRQQTGDTRSRAERLTVLQKQTASRERLDGQLTCLDASLERLGADQLREHEPHVQGVAGLFVSRISWTETKPVVRLGPLQVNSQEDHSLWIPTAAGLAAVAAGLGLVYAGKRSA